MQHDTQGWQGPADGWQQPAQEEAAKMHDWQSLAQEYCLDIAELEQVLRADTKNSIEEQML